MTPKYAKTQPVGFKNMIEKVAIVGVGGTIGSHIASALLKTGKHTITALTRVGSTNAIPSGIHVARVDYNDEATLISALTGQQFLIITMSPTAPRDAHSTLVQAASKAGVPYVMPNSYANDIDDVALGRDILLGPAAKANRDEIESLGMNWIAVCCGLWYDYSLAGGEARFGFDFNKRALTIYDDGATKTATSTLAQIGRAVAKLLSLKELPDDENDTGLALSRFVNKGVYVNSFVLSQNEIFASVKRVTGTTDADWTITHESTRERYEDGLAKVKKGDMSGFGKLLYARVFSPDGEGDMATKMQNELFGLPSESLDEATKGGIDMVEDLSRRVERMAS